jgi:glycosyltransferase involved in cell wall biosynthesis
VERGPALAAIHRRLLARAERIGLDCRQDGTLKGHLDLADGTTVAGWAQIAEHPDTAVQLEILDNGVLVAEVVANHYRADLDKAGIGNGRHAVQFLLAQPLDPRIRHEIVMRRQSDRKALSGSPKIVEPCLPIEDDVGARMAALIEGAAAQARTPAETEALVAQLVDATEQARDAHGRLLARPRDASERRRGGGQIPDKRALVIASQWPRLDRDAGSPAIWSHICALQDLGWGVDFVASAERVRDGAASALEAAGVICHAEPSVTSVEEVLRRHTGRFDLVYLHRLENALAYAGLARQHQSHARLLYSVADLQFLRLSRQAEVEGRPDLARHASGMRERDLLTMRLVDVVITHSIHEAALLERLAPQVRVHVVPWAITPRAIATPWAERRGVVFVGNFGHAPNRDAMHWMVHEVMPLVWNRDPSIACRIVGADLPPRLAATATDPRVQLLGYVPDLSGEYGRARLAVAPLRFGAGIKGQVLEAFGAAVACVMTPIAAEGLPLPAPLNKAVAEDAEGMANLIHRLHADEALSTALGRAGQNVARQEFSDTNVAKALARALDPLPSLGLRQSADVNRVTSLSAYSARA